MVILRHIKLVDGHIKLLTSVRHTSVSPYREIGLARNVEVKISKMFQKGLKLTFSKGHFKIFHNSNIFIFSPIQLGLQKKFLKNLHF